MRFDLTGACAILLLLCVNMLTPRSLQAAQPELRELFTGANKKAQVVCLGDSVTGVYYHTGGRRAYPAMVELGLRHSFPDAHINVINAGISGNTTLDALERLQRDVLDKQPDLVTIMFSLNDMTRVPLADFEANLKSIVDQIHAHGAAVLLCTPNSVFDSPGRPIQKLEAYVAEIRAFADREGLPLADCYAAYEQLRTSDEWAWTMKMSDDIHPNMGGHKLIAETIVHRISGEMLSLENEAPLQPAVPHTLAKLRAGEPITIIAMPPWDELFAATIREDFPEANITLSPWPISNLTLAEIETSADQIRAIKPDCVVIALPQAVLPGRDAIELRRLSWILNKSLSFAQQEWDCIVVSPGVFQEPVSAEERSRQEILHQFVANQDLTLIDRGADVSPADLLRRWWRQQRKGAGQVD